MPECDDTSLLRAIAEQRDTSAFTQIYDRYRKRMFNTAYRILCNAALAEDAVQDAMLSIWQRSSKAVQPRGNAEEWILRIVANKSLFIRRSQRNKAVREERMAMAQSRPQAVVDDVEGTELMATLRSEIDRLPELERTLLACSYCTSMTHREIAKLVDLSQPSVTEKIHSAIERLRRNLTKAGVAAVVPLLSKETIFQAMTTGHACPPGMLERMMAKIASYENAARSASRRVRTRAPKQGGWVPTIVGVTAVAAAGACAWTMSQKQIQPTAKPSLSSAAESGVTAAPGTAQVVPPAPATGIAPINYRWTFETGIPETFVHDEEAWSWEKPKASAPGAMLLSDRIVDILLPAKIPPLPLELIIQLEYRGSGLSSLGADWTGHFESECWTRTPVFARTPRQRRIYFIGGYVINFIGNEVNEIVKCKQSYPSDQIYLSGRNCAIQSIVVRSLQPDDVPESIRDPEALIQRANMHKPKLK